MLGFLFGFNARLGRLHYFLSTIGLAVAMTVVIAAMVGVAIQSGAKATDFSVGSPLTPEHHGTIVGAVVNFGLFMALLFWPGGNHQAPSPTSGEWPRLPDTPPRNRAAASPTATRIARVSNGEFGRRAV